MNLRINPEELAPRPGSARARIRLAEMRYQRRTEMARRRAEIEACEEAKRLQAMLAFAAAAILYTPTKPVGPGAEIVREVAIKHGVRVAHMKGESRTAHLVRARQEAFYRLYGECAHLSMPAIGRFMGGRDHTTVLHGIKEHARRNNLPLIKKETRTRWGEPVNQCG